MELKEMIKVMQHYDNGGTVECAEIGFDEWTVVSHPGWSWTDYKYRIKEQKQKVTIEKWLVKNSYSEYFVVEVESKNPLYKDKVKLIESYEVEL